MTPSHAQEFIEDIPRRVSDLEKFVSTQGTSLARTVDVQADFLKRLEKLEMLAQVRAITEAREDERDKALYSRLDRMEDQIKETQISLHNQIEETKKDLMSVKGVGFKALWVFISAILVAAAAFLVRGGLSR